MPRLALPRIAAWCIDQVCVLLAAGLLALVVGLPLLALAPQLLAGHLLAENAVAFLLLVVPVTVAAARLEHRRGATPGKRLLGLRVRARSGGALPFPAALLRNAGKLALPWTLGHAAVFALARGAADDAAALPVALALVVAYGLPLSAAVLLLGTGRPHYDLVSGAVVVRAERDLPVPLARPALPDAR